MERLKLAEAEYKRGQRHESVTESSGNVFEDLRLANSKEFLAKAELARQVYLIIKKRGLTQTAAASLLGLKQLDVSLLRRARLSRFFTERLIQMLNVLPLLSKGQKGKIS